MLNVHIAKTLIMNTYVHGIIHIMNAMMLTIAHTLSANQKIIQKNPKKLFTMLNNYGIIKSRGKEITD